MSGIKDHIKDIDTRLATLEGHIRGVRQMADAGKSCEEILLQLSAIKGGIEKLSRAVLLEHAENCVKTAIEHNDTAEYDHFIQTLTKFL